MREVRAKTKKGERTKENTAAERQGWEVITSDEHCLRTQRSNYDSYQDFMALWVCIISEHQSCITRQHRPVKISIKDKTHHLHNKEPSVTISLLPDTDKFYHGCCYFFLLQNKPRDGKRTAGQGVFSTLETIKQGGLPSPRKIHRLVIKFLLCGADHQWRRPPHLILTESSSSLSK